MSREVIGAGTTDEAERLPRPRGDARPATVTDLDAPTTAATPTTPAATPRDGDTPRTDSAGDAGDADGAAPVAPATGSFPWPDHLSAWLARPAGVAAVVTMCLLAGGLIGVGVAERFAAERRSDTVRLLGGLAYPTRGFLSDATGGSQVDLLVVNAGPETVRVTGASFVEGSPSELVLPEPFEVGPGESARAAADVQLDCDTPLLSDVSVTVATPGGRTRDVVLPGDGMGGMLADGDLQYLCGAFDGASSLEVFSTVSRGDGSLSMQVRNSTDDAVELTFAGPVGVTIIGDPPFPVTLAPDSSEFLIVRVQVDTCTAAASRPDAGNDLRLLVDEQREQAFLDPVVTAGWLARQVALECPDT